MQKDATLICLCYWKCKKIFLVTLTLPPRDTVYNFSFSFIIPLSLVDAWKAFCAVFTTAYRNFYSYRRDVITTKFCPIYSIAEGFLAKNFFVFKVI